MKRLHVQEFAQAVRDRFKNEDDAASTYLMANSLIDAFTAPQSSEEDDFDVDETPTPM